MRPLAATLATLAALAGTAEAETNDRADFQPVAQDGGQTARTSPREPHLAPVKLRDATPQDIDTDRDGRIGFDELLAKDF